MKTLLNALALTAASVVIAASGHGPPLKATTGTPGGTAPADLFQPRLGATCIGSDDCDRLIETCEKDKSCKFKCHVTWPGEGQACIVGSTSSSRPD